MPIDLSASLASSDPEIADQIRPALAYLLAYCYLFEPDLYRLIETYKSQVFQEWLCPMVSADERATPLAVPFDLTLPRGFKKASPNPFPDAIRAGVFYPAALLLTIGVPTDDEIRSVLV